MAKPQNVTEPPNRDAVSEQQAAESGNEKKESPTMISSTPDQKDGGGRGDDVAMNEGGAEIEGDELGAWLTSSLDEEECNDISLLDIPSEEECDDISLLDIPLDTLFFNLGPINEEENEEPSQTETETSSKKGKQVAAGVSMDSSPNIAPKKRKEGPSLTSSAETPTKRRRGRPPGSGSRSNKRKQKPSPGKLTNLIELNAGQIVAALLDKDPTKETGARIVELGDGPRNDEKNPIAATPHQMIGANNDPASEYSRKVMKEEGCTSGFLPTTPTVGDGNIISPTSATTSASNDKDMKSPSAGDTCN